MIDINNDGIEEIVHAGRTNEQNNSEFKIYVYEQSGNSFNGTPLDVSDQISGFRRGAFAFGNLDLDEDIDFGITGLSNFGGDSSIYLNSIYRDCCSNIYINLNRFSCCL